MARHSRRSARPAGLARVFAAVAFLSACAPAPESYYPLEASRWWYYEVQETILDEARSRRYLVVNAGRGMLSGQDVYLQAAQKASVDYLRYRGAGVERLASRRPGTPGVQPDDPVRVILPEKIEAGAAWSVPSTLALIESRTFARGDRIIVRRVPITLNKTISETGVSVAGAIGSFDDCVRVDGSARALVLTDRGNSEATVVVRTREWYARGIGLVRLERTESSDSSFLKKGRQTWELVDYGT